jgi:hypothetical protein
MNNPYTDRISPQEKEEFAAVVRDFEKVWRSPVDHSAANLVALVERFPPDGVSANTSRTKKCVHADKCQYIPNRAISPGSRGWAADSPLRGSAADWSVPCGEE